jgi:hypothetical protein
MLESTSDGGRKISSAAAAGRAAAQLQPERFVSTRRLSYGSCPVVASSTKIFEQDLGTPQAQRGGKYLRTERAMTD